MYKKFEINWTKIKGRKVVTHNSKSDLPLAKHYLGGGKRRQGRTKGEVLPHRSSTKPTILLHRNKRKAEEEKKMETSATNKLKQRNVKINFFVCNVTAESKTFLAGAIGGILKLCLLPGW